MVTAVTGTSTSGAVAAEVSLQYLGKVTGMQEMPLGTVRVGNACHLAGRGVVPQARGTVCQVSAFPARDVVPR